LAGPWSRADDNSILLKLKERRYDNERITALIAGVRHYFPKDYAQMAPKPNKRKWQLLILPSEEEFKRVTLEISGFELVFIQPDGVRDTDDGTFADLLAEAKYPMFDAHDLFAHWLGIMKRLKGPVCANMVRTALNLKTGLTAESGQHEKLVQGFISDVASRIHSKANLFEWDESENIFDVIVEGSSKHLMSSIGDDADLLEKLVAWFAGQPGAFGPALAAELTRLAAADELRGIAANPGL
jgi:hypothetical protein